MEFSGFFKPYPANRLLKDEERRHQLHQKQRLKVEPAYQLSVIRFNASYMELVDKWFAWRGTLTSVAAFAFALAFAFIWSGIIGQFIKPIEGGWWLASVIFVMCIPFLTLFGWVFKTDAFRFTHFPIRLNRKTRMVHVFRTNGTVLSVPWDEVFFCIASLPQHHWEIQGHVLDKDGVTVKETFALFPEVAGSKSESEANLPRCWEFVRRYMEDGSASVAGLVEYCLPITDRQESFTFGFHRMHSWIGATPLPLMIWILLIYLITYPGRWLAMHTSKLPVWPKEIEAACAADPNDPFRKDASMNKPITDHTPIYFVAAVGVTLLVAWVWW